MTIDNLKKRQLAADLAGQSNLPQPVVLAGWVNSRRDHGGVLFVDLRDHTGLMQLVFHPDQKEVLSAAQNLRDEWVVLVGGQLKARAEDLVNPQLATGKLEVAVDDLLVLNQSPALPIPVNVSPAQAGQTHEDNRLRYRYLDLRRPPMQQRLKDRDRLYRLIRQFMTDNHFTEVPTPILANSSPEGARDFLVPSRLRPGQFYALPQAPQQFKQLLMVGGLDRYFQIAPCFRDEDPRADRLYGDFYQLDLEMSFVADGSVVRQAVNPLVEKLVSDFGRRLTTKTIPEISYAQALADYGCDKPDLRLGAKLIQVDDLLAQTEARVLAAGLAAGGQIKAIVAPAGLSRKQIDELTELARGQGAGGLAYLNLASDGSASGPLANLLSSAERDGLLARTGIHPDQTLLLVADQEAVVNRVLAAVRSWLAGQFANDDPAAVAAVWITDFPFYETDPQTGEVDFGHNPFSRPQGDVSADEASSLLADQYDLVINGYEVCSGAVRNHQPDSLRAAFRRVGYDDETTNARFKGLLEALSFGAPPHAGCAFGLDRLLMILTGETNIRETVAFPKTGTGVDLLMQSPAPIPAQDLESLGLSLPADDKA